MRADDFGVLRGDGVFETMHVRGGKPWLLDEHLARMAGSAARMELALPAPEVLAVLAGEACAAWPGTDEGALRLVCTRGPEGGGEPTVYATVAPVSPTSREQRRRGLAVATATLGYPADLRRTAPWLLGGVKSLSYAVNMATLRWAVAGGYDDVLWTSVDGYALEAPTATLVWLVGDELRTVPAEQTGILPGTTAAWLLDHAGALGWRSATRMVTPAELADADGVWFTSSVRGVAEVRSLDGVERPASSRTAQIRGVLGHPV